MNNKKGFTLIEFIIVMAIIGILVLMAAPKFMDYIRYAKLTQIKNDTRVVEDVLLTEQAKSLTKDQDINKYLIEDVINNKGISKDNKELANIDQGEGVQIDPELIKKHTNTKLNLEGFYFNKESNKVFYYDNKAKGPNNNIDENKYKVAAKFYLSDLDTPTEYGKLMESYGIAIEGWGSASDVIHGSIGQVVDIRSTRTDIFNAKTNQDEKNFKQKINKDTGDTLTFILESQLPFEIQGDTVFISNDNWNKFYISFINKNQLINKVNENFKANVNKVVIEGEEFYNLATKIYNIDINDNEITVNGFNGNYKELLEDPEYKNFKTTDISGNLEADINTLVYLEKTGKKIVKINNSAFQNAKFKGEFPQLNNLTEIGSGAFNRSRLNGSFPKLNKLQTIGSNAFQDSRFTGTFPQLNNLKTINVGAFKSSHFTGEFPILNNLDSINFIAFNSSEFSGEFPELPNITFIGNSAFFYSTFEGRFPNLPQLISIDIDAFRNSRFSGVFPNLNNIEVIQESAFKNSSFTGDFPLLNNLTFIGEEAFYQSEFDNIPNSFYEDWDAIGFWRK